MVSDEHMSGEVMFKSVLGEHLFGTCWVILVFICFVNFVFVGMEEIFYYKLLKCKAGVNSLFLFGGLSWID